MSEEEVRALVGRAFEELRAQIARYPLRADGAMNAMDLYEAIGAARRVFEGVPEEGDT